MKVIVINGSPKPRGNTALALDAVCSVLNKKNIETPRIEIGTHAMHGCIACHRCAREKDSRCVFNDDLVNPSMDAIIAADGILIGSPVYYAGINGALKAFLDRVFFVASASGSLMRHKVGAAVVAVRRGGEIAAWDQLNKYFTISEMFVPSSVYWNMAFGMTPGEVLQDPEGMDTMNMLGENMAWLLEARQNGAAALPALREKTFTNFIR